MARYEDALAGWDIFKSFDYAATLDEINRHLTAQGMSPVSVRMLRHYVKLKRFGYTRYIPINQLDVKTLKDPFWDQAVRNRYTLVAAYAPVDVIVWVLNRKRTFHGIAVETSPSAVTIRFSDPDTVALLRKTSGQREFRRHRVEVYFPYSQQTFYANLNSVNMAVTEQFVVASFGFISMAAVELMVDKMTLPSKHLIFRVIPRTEQTGFSEVTRKFYWLFQSSEAGKLICDEILSHIDDDQQYLLPSTTIKSLRMQSPLEIVVQAALPLAALILLLARATRVTNSSGGDRPKDPLPPLSPETANDQIEQVSTLIQELVGTAPRTEQPQHVPPRVHELLAEQFWPAFRELMDDASGHVEIIEVEDEPK